MEEINFKKIEQKWQKKWEKAKIFEVSEKSKKPKYYVLEMFPYPSGSGLHMGHAWNYTIGDILARFKIMQGFNVLHPMGYDSLGLPAENAAIEVGEPPLEYTRKSIKHFMKQQKELGLSYDWSRMVSSADSSYYKWDQWIFLKMLEKNLAYQKESSVNWCSKCNTVLANEQVHDGKCWRHEDTEVETKHLKQWFLKTTHYADELYEELDNLKEWPEKTKAMQKHWIGKSYGTEIDFEIEGKEDLKNKEFVFLHGYKYDLDDDFWKWLEKEIVSRGGKIAFNKSLPNKTEPNLEEQINFVLDNYDFNENSVIVAHSLGGVLAMKLVSKLKNKINRILFVATPSMNKTKDRKNRPKIDNYCDWEFDFELIKKKVDKISVLIDENDHILRVENGKNLADKLSADLTTTRASGTHFNSKEEPSIIKNLVGKEKWPIFTTRPDTLFGVTFMVVSAQHSKLWDLVTEEQKKDVEKFLDKLKSVSEKDLHKKDTAPLGVPQNAEFGGKEGVFTGSYAVNPINGERVPVYAGNFVVADYGSGMVMAVPAHDQRDFEFAKKMNLEQIGKRKFPHIGIKFVVCPSKKDFDKYKSYEDYSRSDGTGESKSGKLMGEPSIKSFGHIKESYDEFRKKVSTEIKSDKYFHAWEGFGNLINSGKFNGLDNEKAKEKITKFLEQNKVGKKVVQFRLRDWGISRQRYWGTPIPIIHCDKCGAVPVPEKDLPVELPKDVKFGKGNPLETNEKWLNVKCPKCKGKGRREAETMDTFVNSSWYFMRYCDPENSKEIFDKKKVDYWCPVDSYIGGIDHACMHLIYFRFYTKFLADLGLIKFREPAMRLFHQGMLAGEGGVKMSKSKPETCVLPEEVSDKYGMDTARFFLCSLASPDKDIDWSEKGIVGSLRFIKKVFEYYSGVHISKTSSNVEEKLNLVIKNITDYFENFNYRKATIELRELFDLMYGEKEMSKEVLENFLKLLNPICPHITEELWSKLGHKDFISTAKWPEAGKIKVVKKKEEDLNVKVVEMVKRMLRDKKVEKVYLYVVPFELGKLDVKKLEKGIGVGVEVYSLKDEKRYDPGNKAKKARPGMPGIWFE